MKFKEVKAYQCIYCERLFLTDTHHKACIADPDVIHCGTCKHYHFQKGRFATAPFDDDYQKPRHTCDKGHNNAVPRKESCPDYECSFDLASGGEL